MKHFLAQVYESTGRYFCHPDVGVGVGMLSHTLSFMTNFYYVMGKALSGELSSSQTGLVLHFADINFCCLFFLA